MARVLVVEDDDTVAEVAVGYLRRDGHEVRRAATAEQGLALAGEFAPELVVLDLMLPGAGGLWLFRRLRSAGPVAVVVLSALGSERDRVAGLESGVDDYLTKPFSARELALRVRAVLRRTAASAPPPVPAGPLVAGGLTVDVRARRVEVDGAPLSLTVREFDLLAFLLAHPGEVFTRDQLMHEVWGWSVGDPATVTVHVRRLREKVEVDPVHPRLVLTVWGVGYRCDPAGAPAGARTP